MPRLPLKFRRCFLIALCLAAAPVRADQADEIAAIHLEALGGKERIASLAALRASGEVVAGGKHLRFTMIAARPDRVRLETAAEGTRMLVQASDGVAPPWEFDTGKWPPRYETMTENVGRTFKEDAEFDDPLVGGRTRGYAFESVTTTKVENKSYLRVAVTRGPAQSFALLVDADTYLIAMRTEKRQSAGGAALQIVTRYEDYRPVEGVLLPHRVTVAVDGRLLQQTVITGVVANPSLSADTFSRPKSALPAAPTN